MLIFIVEIAATLVVPNAAVIAHDHTIISLLFAAVTVNNHLGLRIDFDLGGKLIVLIKKGLKTPFIVIISSFLLDAILLFENAVRMRKFLSFTLTLKKETILGLA